MKFVYAFLFSIFAIVACSACDQVAVRAVACDAVATQAATRTTTTTVETANVVLPSVAVTRVVVPLFTSAVSYNSCASVAVANFGFHSGVRFDNRVGFRAPVAVPFGLRDRINANIARRNAERAVRAATRVRLR